MADQLKNLMIGLFVTAAAAIVIFILMFLHPGIGDKGRRIHVRFTDIDKVTIGTRVTYAGKPVGEVVGIDEVEQGRGGKTDASGQIFAYELTLLIDSGVHIYNTDEISLRTSGLLGEKNVEITPYAPKPGKELMLMDKDTLYAVPTGSVEETFKEFKQAADKVQVTLDNVNDILNNIKNNHLVDKITETVDNMKSITHALDKPNQWANILNNIERLSTRVNQSWDTVDSALGNIDKAAVGANNLMSKASTIADQVSGGEGTLGKLLVQDETYLRVNSIMGKMETIMDDINHYGILFQTDKGWQRLRARRMNLLQKLQSPQEFRNYFNDEVDQIATSISRVSMVLNEVENNPCCCDVMLDREFTKVFAELMRRVKMLEEEVRMYNIQMVETQVHQTELGEVPCYPSCGSESYYPQNCCCEGDPWMWMPQYAEQ